MGIYLKLPFTTVEFYVWAACIGFNVAMLIVFFSKGAESKLVTKLLACNCTDEKSAKSLYELGLDSWIIKFLLRDKSTLRKVVTLVGGDNRLALQKGAKAKSDFSGARFYITEPMQDRAKSMQKGAVKWYWLPIFCAISVGIAIGVYYLIPIIQNW